MLRCAQSSSEAARCSDDIGLDVWPASPALADYLAEHPGILAQQLALELGSGIGLGGLAAAALGASGVVLSDYASAVRALPRLRRLAALQYQRLSHQRMQARPADRLWTSCGAT